MNEECSHGKTWEEPCEQCDLVSFEGISVPMLKRNCQQAAKFYSEKPGLVGPSQTADLYKVVGHLLSLLEKETGR